MSKKDSIDDMLSIAKGVSNGVKSGATKSTQIIENIEKGKKVLDYYSKSNKTQREKEESEARWWSAREYVLNTNFKILWAVILIVTIAAWILFGYIGMWLNITNTYLLFAVVSGMEIGIIAIFALLLLSLRK